MQFSYWRFRLGLWLKWLRPSYCVYRVRMWYLQKRLERVGAAKSTASGFACVALTYGEEGRASYDEYFEMLTVAGKAETVIQEALRKLNEMPIQKGN